MLWQITATKHDQTETFTRMGASAAEVWDAVEDEGWSITSLKRITPKAIHPQKE